jgi:hypothetical protein
VSFTHSVDRLFGNTWPHSATLSLMTDASSVTKLFTPPSDRCLKRTTTSKLPSERTLNRHKIPGNTNYAWSVRQPFPSNTGLRFSREMAVATIGQFQMLSSLCVIDTISRSCDTSYANYGVTKSSYNLYHPLFIFMCNKKFLQCVRKVVVHLGYGT